MEITLPISSIFVIAIDSIGIVVSLLLSVLFLLRNKTNHISTIFLSLLLLLTGLTLLNDMLTMSGITNRFKNLYFIPIFYSLSIGPLFYLLVKSKYYNKLRSVDYLHLVLPAIQALVYLSIGFRSLAYKSHLWGETSFPIYLEIESYLFPISLVAYSLLGCQLLFSESIWQLDRSDKKYFWTKDLKKWLVGFANGFLLIALVEFCFIVGDFLFGYDFGSIFMIGRSCTFVAFILWVSFNGIKSFYPSNIYQTKPNLGTPLVKEGDLSKHIQQLQDLMEKEKVYLNPDLNLKILAQYLQTAEKTCSHVLSKGLNTNFNQYINKHRVEFFKTKILDGQHKNYTLTSLAFECGFESKSTFNRAFKLFNEMTPSQYVKSIENTQK